MDKKHINLKAEFKIDKKSIRKLNSQFMLVDILVAYTDDNRNYSSIPKHVFEEAMSTLYGIPIVGERIVKETDQSKETWGSHGGKIIITDQGIKYEQTTKPYGFVTQEAVDNAEWVIITEKDGHTKHEYLKIKNCILWYKRYEECIELMDNNFGQSMEIEILDYSYRDDDYLEIHKFEYSALCILGNECEPCFESASIGRHYALDTFKKEFKLMLDEYKTLQYNKTKEDVKKMNEKIIQLISSYKYKNINGKETQKFEIINIYENSIDLIDREDNYKLYSINFSINEETNEILIDFENKIEKSISLTDKKDVEFSIQSEIEKISAEKVDFATRAYESNIITDLNAKYQELEQKYTALVEINKQNEAKLTEYDKAKKDAEFELHKKDINDKLKEYESKMGAYSEYLIYCSKVNYEKTIEQVNTDMLLLLGKFNMNKPTNFSYRPQEIGTNNINTNDIIHSRYGDLFDKIEK